MQNGSSNLYPTASTVAVVGLGKIGLPLAVQYARHGRRVIGCDINPEVVETVLRLRLPVSLLPRWAGRRRRSAATGRSCTRGHRHRQPLSVRRPAAYATQAHRIFRLYARRVTVLCTARITSERGTKIHSWRTL